MRQRLPRVRRIFCRVGKHQYRNFKACLFKIRSSLQRVSTVVAWTSENKNWRACRLIVNDLASQITRGTSSALHQRKTGQGSKGGMLDIADFSYRVESGRRRHGMREAWWEYE